MGFKVWLEESIRILKLVDLAILKELVTG